MIDWKNTTDKEGADLVGKTLGTGKEVMDRKNTRNREGSGGLEKH